MKMKRVLALVLAGVMSTSMLTGCGDKPSSEVSEGFAPESENVVEEETETSKASGEGKTITLYTHQGNRVLGEEKKDENGNTYRDEDTAALKHLAEKYEEETGVHVDLNVISNADDLRPLFQVEDPSVDIYTYPDWTIEEWQAYAEPYMTLEEGREIYGEYADTMFGDGENIYMVQVGKAYDNCVVYNEEAIKAVGYNEIPGDLAEFEQLCQKLKEAGTTPISLHRIENWPLESIKAFANYVSGDNRSFDSMLKSDAPFNDTEPIGKTIKQYTEWKSKGFFEPEVYTDFGVAMDSVAYGDAAMMLFGSWVIPQIQGRVPEGSDPSIIKFAPAPDFGQGRIVTAASADGYAISKFSKNKEEARKFIEYVSENAEFIAEAGNIAMKKGVEPIIPEVYSIIDSMVESGEAKIIFVAAKDQNAINNEEVLAEANLLADQKWAGNLFDALDVTKADDWSEYNSRVDAQNKAYAEAKKDLGVSWTEK